MDTDNNKAQVTSDLLNTTEMEIETSNLMISKELMKRSTDF
jgi:hypothetical protein